MIYLAVYWVLTGLAMQGVSPYPETWLDRFWAFLLGGLFWPIKIMQKMAD